MTYVAACPTCHKRFVANYIPDRARARLAAHVATHHPDTQKETQR